jgi:glycosyltransferase involved in cell wall biosynthesis
MNQIRIGITAKNFYLWDGGIDFIATIAQGIENDVSASTYLLLKDDSFFLKIVKMMKIVLKNKFSITRIQSEAKNYHSRYDKLISVFQECSPNTEILWYKGNYYDDDHRIMDCLCKYKIDILMPHNGYFIGGTRVPWVGYMYDFQHEYLPELFSENDIKTRREELRARLKNSKYIIVNAKDVKDDIEKFYPENESTIFVLPFAPFQKPKLSGNSNLPLYNLPKRYFMISNQFWHHKNHLVAFEALEKLYNDGYHDIHIVCSGKLEDSRNPEYMNKLKNRVKEMNCQQNIHFLGYIPKPDQIAIMRNAIGLIQPTLCEGGPGGGAVYNALCLGITCLISDIRVNREITGYDNVYFFDPNNSSELAQLMLDHSLDHRLPDDLVERKIEENKRFYSESLINFAKKIAQDFQTVK